MPKDGECVVITSHGTAYKYECGDVVMYGDAYNETADAIELPPHGRLGDLDSLKEIFADELNRYKQIPLDNDDKQETALLHLESAMRIITNAQTIIPAEGGSDGCC